MARNTPIHKLGDWFPWNVINQPPESWHSFIWSRTAFTMYWCARRFFYLCDPVWSLLCRFPKIATCSITSVSFLRSSANLKCQGCTASRLNQCSWRKGKYRPVKAKTSTHTQHNRKHHQFLYSQVKALHNNCTGFVHLRLQYLYNTLYKICTNICKTILQIIVKRRYVHGTMFEQTKTTYPIPAQ